MQDCQAEIHALLKKKGVDKPYFCLHSCVAGDCKFDDAACSKVQGRTIKHDAAHQLPHAIKMELAKMPATKKMLDANGPCVTLRKKAIAHDAAFMAAIDNK
jgi:hypothetical protein